MSAACSVLSAGLLAGCASAEVVENRPRGAASTVVQTVVVDDVPVLRPEGFGAVRLGMTTAELQRTGEVGEVADMPEASCVMHELKRAKGWVGVDAGVAVEIWLEGGARTADGLRFGDSRERMRAVYPQVVMDQHGFTLAAGSDVRYFFYFVSAGDTLTGMGINRPTTGCR